MIPFALDRLRHETRRLLARVLVRGRLHRIRYARFAGTEIVLKSRRPGSGVAIVVGNHYLRLQRSGVEVMSGNEWIDFDTRHHPHLSEPDRRADDCRALICSAASRLPQSCYPRLAAEFIASHPDASTLHRFRQRLTTDWRRPNTFQLAQAPLSWTETSALFRALLQSSTGM